MLVYGNDWKKLITWNNYNSSCSKNRAWSLELHSTLNCWTRARPSPEPGLSKPNFYAFEASQSLVLPLDEARQLYSLNPGLSVNLKNLINNKLLHSWMRKRGFLFSSVAKWLVIHSCNKSVGICSKLITRKTIFIAVRLNGSHQFSTSWSFEMFATENTRGALGKN